MELPQKVAKAMESRLYQLGVFALYQLSVLLGIFLLPVALAAQKLGVPLPLHRVLNRLDEAYDHATPN
ncbi:hypothetical protein OB920_03830 [Halobacteria archaeon HArc-gm2]|nr:hypothetical protein [Halobacteria archaeon HArc-gm2]